MLIILWGHQFELGSATMVYLFFAWGQLGFTAICGTLARVAELLPLCASSSWRGLAQANSYADRKGPRSSKRVQAPIQNNILSVPVSLTNDSLSKASYVTKARLKEWRRRFYFMLQHGTSHWKGVSCKHGGIHGLFIYHTNGRKVGCYGVERNC